MKLLDSIKVLLLPILAPISFLYGLIAFINKKVAFKKYQSPNFVVSVGNLQAGGTGKSPFVIALSHLLLDKDIEVSVVFKSYKASLTEPKEVFETDDAKVVGDEALLCKQLNPRIRVFSGPKKFKSIEFADTIKNFRGLYILDDGAQHHKIKKDFSIMIWDFSVFLLDFFPFPLGRGREFWFLIDKPHVNLTSKYHIKKKSLFCNHIKHLDYKITKIENPATLNELNQDYTLISGIGNFQQFKTKVLEFTSQQKMKSFIKKPDHSDFSDFQPQKNCIYVCTEKDYVKLKKLITPKHLYVVKSEYSSESLKEIKIIADKIYNLYSNSN